MQYIIRSLISLGSILMVYNIYCYIKFIRNLKDVMSAGKRKDRIWQIIALLLLIFFLVGYIFIGFFSRPDLMMAGVLFGGSIFVIMVETLMFRLVETVKERSLDISEVLIGVIEARDPNLNGHSRNVQNLTMCLYEYLPSEMKNKINPVSLQYAALMHDVGKLGVPEIILDKHGKLNMTEWDVMREHPRIGVKLLKPLHTFDRISDWILYHHERIDGKGYYGISGEQIPLPARIISVADTYSAITMRRAYKKPKSHEEAIRILKQVAGTQLDEELVNIFCQIPKEKLLACAPEVVDIIRS